MPRDSIEAAKEWHMLNVGENTHARKNSKPPTPAKKKADPAPKKANPKPAAKKKPPARKSPPARQSPTLPAMAPGDGLRAAIDVLEKDAQYLQGKMRDHDGGDEDDIKFQKFYRGEHLSVVEQLRKIEKDYQGIQNDQKKSVSVEEVGQVLGELFREFRRRLDNMARRCASMVPPEVAPVVEKAVDKEVRTMMGGLNECDYIS